MINGDWARDVATAYRDLAGISDKPAYLPRKRALYAAAAEYDQIGVRMDTVGALLGDDA